MRIIPKASVENPEYSFVPLPFPEQFRSNCSGAVSTDEIISESIEGESPQKDVPKKKRGRGKTRGRLGNTGTNRPVDVIY